MSPHNQFDRNALVADAEKSLRLLATLPAPQGIEERVKAALRTPRRQAAVFRWPFAADRRGGWMRNPAVRAAAAAAIVAVVAGGGWEVYSHIRVAPEPAAIAVPQPIDGHSGLSTAGAMRTPQTLDRPKVAGSKNAKAVVNPDDGAAASPSRTNSTHRKKPAIAK